jgi:hypothetical protein
LGPDRITDLEKRAKEGFDAALKEVLEKHKCSIPITMREYTEEELQMIDEIFKGMPSNGLYSNVDKKYIVIREGFVKDSFRGDKAPGWDGYREHVYDDVTPEEAVMMMILHEIAHDTYGADGTDHADLTVELIAKVLNIRPIYKGKVVR